MKNVTVVGNAILDLFLSIQDANAYCELDKKNCKLCVRYGQKILLDECEFLLGGNAANVSIGLRRLGFNSSLMAEIADDEFAEKITNVLKKEGVGIDSVIQKHGQSSFSVGLNFQGERTLFISHQDREHNFNIDTLKTEAIYLTSLGAKWEHVYKGIYEYKRKNKEVLLFCNPGSVQLADDSNKINYLFDEIDVLFLNKQEAQHLLGKNLETADLLTAFKEKGVKIVCITDGKNGSSAVDMAGKMHQQEILKAHVKEKTGAGDSFATGFMAAILSGEKVETGLIWGSANSASVVEHIGAQSGLLSREALENRINNL